MKESAGMTELPTQDSVNGTWRTIDHHTANVPIDRTGRMSSFTENGATKYQELGSVTEHSTNESTDGRKIVDDPVREEISGEGSSNELPVTESVNRTSGATACRANEPMGEVRKTNDAEAQKSIDRAGDMIDHPVLEPVNGKSRTNDRTAIELAERESISEKHRITDQSVLEYVNGLPEMTGHKTNETNFGKRENTYSPVKVGITENLAPEPAKRKQNTTESTENDTTYVKGGNVDAPMRKSVKRPAETTGLSADGSKKVSDGPNGRNELGLGGRGHAGATISKRRGLRNVVVISLAFMLHFTAFQGAGNLQSSINASAGLGTASLATIYGALILSNTFLPVLVIRWLGCKWAVALSLAAYMPYIAVQFGPSFYTLVPAALLVGLGGGPLWCAKCTYLSAVAEQHSRLGGTPVDQLTVRFFGVFFAIFQFSQVWGNLISSLVFSTGVDDDMAKAADGLCGAGFCPGTSAGRNDTNLGRPSDEKIYTVAGIYLGCMALAICIVALGVDSLKRYGEDSRGGSGAGLGGFQLLAVTTKLLKEPRQLLVIPIVMWMGMEQAFISADYTASYVTCAWGVSNVGFVMICYGAVNAASSLTTGSLVRLTGRVPLVTAAALLNVGLIAAMLLWSPSAHHKAVFFVLAGLWGAADGVWLVQINAMCGFLFPGREEAAYSNFRLWESLGFIVAYSYSSVLCTGVKLYILLVLLLVGLAGYYVIEWQLRREVARPKTEKN
ncbi:protein unc-93 homolog A-like isoform X2 [Bacillus rossius redtenbacheri]|uniref:protein unc-93 homolog A-like isoform X2 n=1 Tax=Bacillus rossius redtenbacheri TaxID=93214 RepID=UPI002FDDC0EB